MVLESYVLMSYDSRVSCPMVLESYVLWSCVLWSYCLMPYSPTVLCPMVLATVLCPMQTVGHKTWFTLNAKGTV